MDWCVRERKSDRRFFALPSDWAPACLAWELMRVNGSHGMQGGLTLGKRQLFPEGVPMSVPLNSILDRFAERTPIPVMARGELEPFELSLYLKPLSQIRGPE
jgi:hypothetical protein